MTRSQCIERDALVQAEEALQRVQVYVGLLRQHDPELSMLVARAREKANAALAAGQIEAAPNA